MMLRGMKIALTPQHPLPERRGGAKPRNSRSPRPLGEGLGVRVLETST